MKKVISKNIHSQKFVWSLLEGRGGLRNFLDDKITKCMKSSGQCGPMTKYLLLSTIKQIVAFQKPKYPLKNKCNFLLCHGRPFRSKSFINRRQKNEWICSCWGIYRRRSGREQNPVIMQCFPFLTYTLQTCQTDEGYMGK